MAFDKQNSAGFLANHMARLFAHGLHQRIKPLGLAPAQFMVLLELWDEDRQTQKTLADHLDVEQPTMANTIARMIRDGLIVRIQHPNDKRAQCLILTNKARELEKPAKLAALEQNKMAYGDMDEGEQERFMGAMRVIIGNMK